MNSIRAERLQKELLKIVNSAFQGSISDPRLTGIEITRIKVSKDLKLMKAHFSNFDNNLTENETLNLLIKSSGFIKKQIAGANIMRTIPEIVFEYDKTNERVMKMDEIFNTLAEERKNNNYYDDDNDNDYYDDSDELLDEDLEDYDEYNDDLDEDLEYDYDDIEDEDED